MIIIISDGHDNEATVIRNSLIRCGLPCAVDDAFIAEPLVVITFADGGLNNVDPEIVIYADANLLNNDAALGVELERVTERILDVFFVKYGLIQGTLEYGPISITEECVKYFGKPIHFTSTEKLITSLLILNKGKWLSADVIAKQCLTDKTAASAVSVHVNSINKKSLQCSPIGLILSRRFSGYKLSIK